MKVKESDIALPFISFFEDDGYEIYKEVQAGGIIDFVAVKGKIKVGVEVKTSFSFAVMEQAHRNKAWCHYCYVAVPRGKWGVDGFKRGLCEHLGIGVLTLNKWGKVQEEVWAHVNRPLLDLKLFDYQKQSVAGSQNDRMTHFKATIEELKQYVVKHPGCTFNECFRELNYMHYNYTTPSSAKSCIANYIREGIVTGIRLDNGRFYPESTEGKETNES